MDEKKFNIRSKIIRETFDDKRTLVSPVNADELNLNEHVHQGGDMFITSDGEIIDLEFQETDFTEDELVKYVELAEELYEKIEKEVSIYIICPKDIGVYVKEIEIRSDADFTIKLACIPEERCELILNYIKHKIKANEKLSEDDINALNNLPVKCRKENRNYYRRETIRIMNRLHY